MGISLQVTRDEVRGELAVLVAPGTTAAVRDKLLDDELTEPLFEAARELGAVLAADPHDYAHAVDGKDEQGRTKFVVHARVEGDRLLPVGQGKRRRRMSI
jgi:hypothetical protein